MNRPGLFLSSIAGIFTCSLVLGCGITSNPSAPTAAPQLQGRVHGGQQPVVGSTIQLFAAGTAGYGTGAVSLLTAPVTTDANGNFSITGDYTCPSAGSQLYIVATGGNPGLSAGTNNAALALMAALGPCQLINGQYALNPSLFINLDEVTTVAAAYALSGFMSADATAIGASATNPTGLANAFATAGNLVNITTGQALATTPAGNGTVPQATLNALANILSACINSSGSGTPCSTLFAAATPGGGTAPTNTLQAVLNIAQHPASNTSALYNTIAATAPFQPTLASAPNDWTLTVSFATPANQNGAALDAQGNLWVANQNTSPIITSSSLAEFDNLGAVISGTSGYTGGGLSAPSHVAVDPTGNVWTLNNSNLSKFSSTGTPISPATGYQETGSALAIDGVGDVWITAGPYLARYDNSGNPLSNSPYTGGGLTNGVAISVDGTENIWVTSPSSGVNGRVSEFTNLGVALSPSGGFSTNSTYYAKSVANDSFGNAWTSAQSSFPLPSSITKIAPDGTILSGTSGFQDASLSFPYQIAVSGDDHVWTMSLTPSGGSALIELDNSGNFLSGSTGLALPAGIVSIAIAIDSSGNIWLPGQANVIDEVIGVTAPTVTPLSVAVRDNKLGSRP